MAVEEKTTKKTSYIILQQIFPPDSSPMPPADKFEVVDEVSAITSRQAISDVVKRKKYEDGTFVAVPSRSFQKTTIRSEQVSRIIFE